MRPADIVFAVAASLLGAWAGQALGGLLGLLIGAPIGLLSGFGALFAGIRLLVAVPVLAGTVVGGVLGHSIARVLCFPGECGSAAVAAALLAGAGTLVGVGLVAALVTRSFDESREARNPDQGS